MRRAFLHGFLGDPAVWTGIAREGDIAVALPGHRGGGAVRPTWAENLAMVGDAIAGCDVVVGYSLGARMALGLLASGAVARAVLISVNPGIADADPEHENRVRDASRARDAHASRHTNDAGWAARFRMNPLAQVLDAWEGQPLFATQARVDPARLAERRARRLALDPEQLARSLEAMGLAEMPDYRAVITAERCALIAGAEDAKYIAIARGLPAPLAIIDRCGHDPLLEQPDALATVLTSLA